MVPSPAASDGASGLSGTGPGVAWDELDHGPSPLAFTARTCTRYFLALSSPSIVELNGPIVQAASTSAQVSPSSPLWRRS